MVSLKNISKYYINDKQITAGIKDVTAEFAIGEFIAITGASGSGKTTLLNILSGTDSYNEGNMKVFGRETEYFDESDWEKYRKELVGFVYQDYNLIENVSVYRNVEIAYDLNCGAKDSKEKKEEILLLIEKVGLKGLQKQKAYTLSGGEKQRVAIARALAKNTPIILADEPTGNLDSDSSKEIIELLKSISENKLIIVVTHNTKQFAEKITREIILEDGKILSDKKIQNIINGAVEKEPNNTLAKNKNTIGKIIKNNFIISKRSNAFFCFVVTIVTLIILLVFSAFLQTMAAYSVDLEKTPVFGRVERERLILNKLNGGAFSDSDLTILKNSPDYNQVVENDIILDIIFDMEFKNEFMGEHTNTYYGNTVESYKASKDNLRWGKFPENYDEVLVSSESSSFDYGDAVKEDGYTYIKYSNTPFKPSIKIKIVGGVKDSIFPGSIYFTKEMAKDLAKQSLDGYSEFLIKNTVNQNAVKNRFTILIDDEAEEGKIYLTRQSLTALEIGSENDLLECQLSNNYLNKKIDNIKWGYIGTTESFLEYNIKDDGYAAILSSKDYNNLVGEEIYQVSVYMKNPSDYKNIIASLETDYNVFYPYCLNIINADAQNALNYLTVSLISATVAVVLIIVSILVLRRSYAFKYKRNALFLSLGYNKKQLVISSIIENAVLLVIGIIVNIAIVIAAIFMKKSLVPEANLNKTYVPLTNLPIWIVVLICLIISSVYLLFIFSRLKKSGKNSINQTLKQGGKVL